jgi:hypothetical protein
VDTFEGVQAFSGLEVSYIDRSLVLLAFEDALDVLWEDVVRRTGFEAWVSGVDSRVILRVVLHLLGNSIINEIKMCLFLLQA